MNTFLPVPNFSESAKMLDYRRLGKQRIEAKQILLALEGKTEGYKNHPATRMWKGYQSALALYGWTCCAEWIRRGFKDTTQPFFWERIKDLVVKDIELPAWIGDEKFHAAHRSNLLRKDFPFYCQYNWTEGVSLEYVWPPEKI